MGAQVPISNRRLITERQKKGPAQRQPFQARNLARATRDEVSASLGLNFGERRLDRLERLVASLT